MDKHHNIKNIQFQKQEMIINIDDKLHSFQLKKISSRLLNATDKERENYIISPSGYGIHWPVIDEDLSIDGLLGLVHQTTNSPQPFPHS